MFSSRYGIQNDTGDVYDLLRHPSDTLRVGRERAEASLVTVFTRASLEVHCSVTRSTSQHLIIIPSHCAGRSITPGQTGHRRDVAVPVLNRNSKNAMVCARTSGQDRPSAHAVVLSLPIAVSSPVVGRCGVMIDVLSARTTYIKSKSFIWVAVTV